MKIKNKLFGLSLMLGLLAGITSCGKAKSFNIVWKNADGTVIKEDTVSSLEDLKFDGETPVKTNTAEYTYSFDGWEKKEENGEYIYIAKFSATKNKYNVTFKDEDGTILKEAKAYEYGTKASDIEKPENPTKAYETEYSYAFSGWDKEISDVTGDVTYTATYEAILNRYNVIFLDEDGETVLKEGEFYYYGTLASDIVQPETPTKESTVENDYVFAGWDKEITNVNGNAAYIATYKESPRKYTVTFIDENGKVLSEEKYDYGTLPSNMNIPNPTKEKDKQYTYIFTGWGKEVETVTGDTTYQAQFSRTVNKYTVIFVDEDGTLLNDAKSYDYGTKAFDIEKPVDPTKEKTDEFTYTFNGWDKEISDVTGDVVYKATYTATKNKYWISFVNYDGTPLIVETQYEYGTLPENIVQPDFTPIREAEVDTVFTFKGWDSQLSTVTCDFTYIATYDEATRKYTVIFKDDDGKVLSEAKYDYGTLVSNITIPTPTKEADKQYTYSFAGWDKEVETVTENVTYQASYTATVNKYTVKFVSEDTGWEYSSISYDYGTLAKDIITPSNPEKSRTAQYTYTFAGWDKELVDVTEDAIYKVMFTAILNKYTVKFINEDGTILSESKYDYGTLATEIEKPADPVKKATAEYTYTFNGWDNEIVDVIKDTTYTATYTEALRSYNATITQTIEEAGTVKAIESSYLVHSKINLEAELNGNYSFLGWYDGEDFISEDLKCEYEMPTNDINIIAKFADLRLTIKSGDGGKKSGYYVTYDLNYEGAAEGEKVFIEAGEQVPYKTVTRQALDGIQYDFMYWCLDKEGNQIFDEDTPIREDMTIYAKWFNNTVVNYAKILKPSSAQSTRSSDYQPSNYGSTYYYFATKDTTITLNYMSRSSGGFKFELTNMTQNKMLDNWYHNPSGVDSYHEMNIQVKTGDILKFKFGIGKGNPAACYARFYLSNMPTTPTGLGVVSSYDNEMVKAGTKITVSAEPIMYEEVYNTETHKFEVSKNGYTFIGWYNGDKLVSTNHVFTFYMPKESVTYEPKYVESTVVIKKNRDDVEVEATKFYLGEKTTLKAYPSLGLTFLGWFDIDDNLLTRELELEIDVTDVQTTYKAIYSTQTVLINYADSTLHGIVTADLAYNNSQPDVPTVGTKVMLYARVSTYTFMGWYVNDELYSMDLDIEVEATDQIVQYIARFSLKVFPYVSLEYRNYGKVEVDSSTITYVGDVATVTAIANEGYEFVCWYLEDGTVYSTDAVIHPTVTDKCVMYYAKFKKIDE